MTVKRFLKIFSILLFILIVFSIYNSIYFDIPRKELEEKYATYPSDFLILNNGSRIHYRDQGNISGPTIMLLHGFTSSLFSFDRLVPLLTKDYRVISYDFPGFGLTGAVPSRDYSFQSLLDSVSEIRKELKIEELILLGHSMGGRVAWHYAAEHPDEIEGLIIVGSGVIANDKDFIKFQENNGDPIIFDLLRADFPFKDQLLYFTPKFFAAQGAKTSIYDQALVTEELITLFHELALLDGTRLAFGDMMSQVKKNDFIDNLDLLKSIEVPTLVIHGEKDNLVNLWSVKYFEEYIDDVDVQYYSDIGHFPIYEDPQRSFKDINKFILSLK